MSGPNGTCRSPEGGLPESSCDGHPLLIFAVTSRPGVLEDRAKSQHHLDKHPRSLPDPAFRRVELEKIQSKAPNKGIPPQRSGLMCFNVARRAATCWQLGPVRQCPHSL